MSLEENPLPSLPHIHSHSELKLYDLIPNIVWIFDIDKHGWWWGNQPAIDFWGLESLQALIDKDLSGDTQGARDRIQQTFLLAAEHGLTVDPWTTYPEGKPKTLIMMHRAVWLGPEKHRGIIAYINEQVQLGEQPENLLLMEAMRYTRVPATIFNNEGKTIVKNPSATDVYKNLLKQDLEDKNEFIARFLNPKQGADCFQKIGKGEEGRWEYPMRTSQGTRIHSIDIRRTRHPLTGEFLFLMVEYDVTALREALSEVEKSHEKLHQIAMKDTLTGVYSLHYLQEMATIEIARATRHQQQLHLMFIDLDGFKSVNDQFGHHAGDQVLCEVARRIQSETRPEDLVARLGGDEFVVFITSNQKQINFIAERILKQLSQPIAITQGEVTIGASIGVSGFPQHGSDLNSLIKAADLAMYQSKQNGKGKIIYTE